LSLVLAGFMGTGKTTLGRMLAARLGCRFLDVDALIEASEGMSIPEIFRRRGEPYFRRREREIIAKLSRERHLVVAVGGGAMVDEVNLEHLRRIGPVVCLWARPEVIVKRLREDRSRPLLQGPNRLRRVHELLERRHEAYARADLHLDTSDLSPEEAVQRLLEMLPPESRRPPAGPADTLGGPAR